ncbi:CpaD family pilus assembly protein [Phenylobacterium sp.]|jgi:pilus assembly protein CpaD|uniref:CpaD family pilus assembly protein n=1 Tax=Phenylobacterium sp. TaxID=1871053 RepID=UPI002F3F55D3
MTRILFRSLVAAGLAATLGACATKVPGADDQALTPTQRFEAKVTSRPEEVLLAVHAQGLSPRQGGALSKLADDWRGDEGGVIGIQAPAAGVDPGAAYRMSEATRGFLISRGVPADKIEIVGYDPAGSADGPPPLRVGYLRYHAEIPECGKTWTNIARSWKNDVQPNFGCAVTANMAAQMADPADLLGPRAMAPQDATRRQEVLDKYRKGEVTSSAKDDKADGAISRAVN